MDNWRYQMVLVEGFDEPPCDCLGRRLFDVMMWKFWVTGELQVISGVLYGTGYIFKYAQWQQHAIAERAIAEGWM